MYTTDGDEFIEAVRSQPVIAFRGGEYGYSVSTPKVGYYAPLTHPGGGNLHDPNDFLAQLGDAFIKRMETPALRTLRPTARPIPTKSLVEYLNSAFGQIDFAAAYAKAPGDHPYVVDYEVQVTDQTIAQYDRPELQESWEMLKRDAMSEALDFVIDHATSARELCEVGAEFKLKSVQLHLRQTSAALKHALELLLKP